MRVWVYAVNDPGKRMKNSTMLRTDALIYERSSVTRCVKSIARLPGIIYQTGFITRWEIPIAGAVDGLHMCEASGVKVRYEIQPI